MDKPKLRDPFYFFRVIGDQFEIRRSKEILGYVRDTQQRGARAEGIRQDKEAGGAESDSLRGGTVMIQIEVPGIPPSLNKMRNMNHYVWNREKAMWSQIVGYEANRHKPPQPFERARVTLTFHFRDRRRRDPDNAIGGAKFLLDPLVDMGFIVDDSFDHIELVAKKGEPDKRNPRVVITIEEVKGDRQANATTKRDLAGTR